MSRPLFVSSSRSAPSPARDTTPLRPRAVAATSPSSCRQGSARRVFSDSAGLARHLVVRKNGDVIVGMLDQRRQTGGVLVLRDANKDGHADQAEQFGESGVHGVALAGDSTLFVSTAVGGDSLPAHRFAAAEEARRHHRDRSDQAPRFRRTASRSTLRGNLIVNIGAASDGCQAKEVPNAPGRDPCPELETSGGIWSFHTDKTNQTIKDGVRIATGLHNAVALDGQPARLARLCGLARPRRSCTTCGRRSTTTKKARRSPPRS